MKNTRVFSLILIILIFSPVFINLQPVKADLFGNGFIPPTPAIKTIKVGLNNVSAINYTSFTTFVKGSGLDIIADFLANTITFSTTGTGTGNATILTDLGDVTLTSPAYHSIFIFNGSQWIDKLFQLDSKTCGGTDKVSSINNQTGAVTCTPDLIGGSGNSTVLNDLGDVILTGANYGDMLFHNGITWINRQFMINNQTNHADQFIIGINNQTGVITRNQFSVNTQTCAGSDRVSAIDNVTGQVTCTTITGGSGNATVLNDLGDVVISTTAYGHILQANSANQYVNKRFMINNQTNHADQFIIGINNATGVITRNQFSINNFTNTNGLTKDVFITGINNVTGQLSTQTFSVNNQTVAANTFIRGINNLTGVITTGVVAGGGNATLLNDLGDVVLTSSANNHILQYKSGQWINKLFTINNQTNHKDQQIIGINNATGVITRNQFSINNFTNVNGLTRDTFLTQMNNVSGQLATVQFSINNFTNTNGLTKNVFITGMNNVSGQLSTQTFSINTRTCGGTDKVSAIDNVTGQVTCATDQTGGGGSGIPLPPKKWGELIPKTASADTIGLVAGCTIQTTASYVYDTTDNSGAILSTTAITDGVNGGIQCTSANFNVFRGDQNAYQYSKWEANKITTNRLFIGFTSGATLLPNNADTILDSLIGIGLCIRTSDTIYQFCRNDGDATTDYVSTGITEDTLVHTFIISTVDAGITWCGQIDGGTAVCWTTEIPTATTRLYAESTGETDGGATAILWTQYLWYLQSDK